MKKKRWIVVWVLAFLALPALAVFKEDDLTQTLRVLQSELKADYEATNSRNFSAQKRIAAQHQQLVMQVENSNELSLMLYSQPQDHTFDLTYALQQATRQYEQLCRRLQHSELHHYEVSNFAQEGFESRHNSAYWDHTPYLGLGPSAHSFDGKSRQWNPANLSQYLHNIEEGRFYEEREVLDEKALYNETLLLSLRTRKGLNLNALRDRFGTSRVDTLLEYFHIHVPQAHYTETESRLRLTEAGLWFADGIAGDAFEI